MSYVIRSRNDNKLVFQTFDKVVIAKPVFHSDYAEENTIPKFSLSFDFCFA